MPERIRLSRARGWRLPEGAVNVARPGKLGNLWIVGTDGTRLQCAAMYAICARGFIDLGGRIAPDDQLALWKRLQPRALAPLRGRDIACWCALDGGPCHGDIVLHLANPGFPLPSWLLGGIELPRVRLGMDARDFVRMDRKKREREAAGA